VNCKRPAEKYKIIYNNGIQFSSFIHVLDNNQTRPITAMHYDDDDDDDNNNT
jgi:hypothetical protein